MEVATLVAAAATTEGTRGLASILGGVGFDAVDGSISGLPPHVTGTTRLYLLGARE